MHFFVTVETEDSGSYNCVVISSESFYAEAKARKHYIAEGEVVIDVNAEMFDTFQHGDISDYEII